MRNDHSAGAAVVTSRHEPIVGARVKSSKKARALFSCFFPRGFLPPSSPHAALSRDKPCPDPGSPITTTAAEANVPRMQIDIDGRTVIELRCRPRERAKHQVGEERKSIKEMLEIGAWLGEIGQLTRVRFLHGYSNCDSLNRSLDIGYRLLNIIERPYEVAQGNRRILILFNIFCKYVRARIDHEGSTELSRFENNRWINY